MNLLQPFRDALANLGVQADQKILVAISGGLDSTALLHLSVKAGLQVSAAHVNFKLRGADSDGDEKFVRDQCSEWSVPFFSASLPIHKDLIKDGVQAEARKLRYGWFDSLMKSEGFDFLFTAHHQDDLIETFFINLQRGAGLKGLKSIPGRNGYILRPLLHFPKGELQAYAKSENFTWREDRSNETDDYLRNRIRHGLAKEFSKLSDHADYNAVKSFGFLAEADTFLQKSAKEFLGRHTRNMQGTFKMRIADAAHLWEYPALGKYVLDELGFDADHLQALRLLADSQTGKKLEGRLCNVFRDRDHFVFAKASGFAPEAVEISGEKGGLESPIIFRWEVMNLPVEIKKSDKTLAILGLSKLQFPLLLRRWRPGDRFVPFGMQGSKKLSDFLTDLKLSIPEKEKVFVLVSGQHICWVVGLRIDERYKVEVGSEKVLFCQVVEPL